MLLHTSCCTHTHTHEQAVGKQPQTCFCCHVCQGVSATCARLSATKIFQQLHNNTIRHQETLSHFSQHQSMSITMFRGECIFWGIIHVQQRNDAIGCRPFCDYPSQPHNSLGGEGTMTRSQNVIQAPKRGMDLLQTCGII